MADWVTTSVAMRSRVGFDVFGAKKQKGGAAGDGSPFGVKTVEVVLRLGRSGGLSLGVLALPVALVPSGRKLSGSPRRDCNLDLGCSRDKADNKSPILYEVDTLNLRTAFHAVESQRYSSPVVNLARES